MFKRLSLSVLREVHLEMHCNLRCLILAKVGYYSRSQQGKLVCGKQPKENLFWLK